MEKAKEISLLQFTVPQNSKARIRSNERPDKGNCSSRKEHMERLQI